MFYDSGHCSKEEVYRAEEDGEVVGWKREGCCCMHVGSWGQSPEGYTEVINILETSVYSLSLLC